MKKIIFTEEQINEIIKYYTIDILGTRPIAKIFNVSREVIDRILRENNVILDTTGRRFQGGIIMARKRYHLKNKTKKSQYYKKWSNQNRENLRIYHKEWRDNNREHINKQSREWIQNKINTDIQFKINQRIRTALWQNLKEQNLVKYKRTFEILPYTLEELMRHLEQQFIPEMIWDNYGEWHIDHIKPLASFNFNSIEDPQFIECWSLSNLRPMWATKRIINGVEYEGNLNKGKKTS